MLRGVYSITTENKTLSSSLPPALLPACTSDPLDGITVLLLAQARGRGCKPHPHPAGPRVPHPPPVRRSAPPLTQTTGASELLSRAPLAALCPLATPSSVIPASSPPATLPSALSPPASSTCSASVPKAPPELPAILPEVSKPAWPRSWLPQSPSYHLERTQWPQHPRVKG